MLLLCSEDTLEKWQTLEDIATNTNFHSTRRFHRPIRYQRKLQQQTPITSTIIPISTFHRNYDDVKTIINHTKSNHAAHNDTLPTANALRTCEVLPLRLMYHDFLRERDAKRYFCLEYVMWVRTQHQPSGTDSMNKLNNTGTWFLGIMTNYVMGHL